MTCLSVVNRIYFCTFPLERLLKDIYLLPWSDSPELEDIINITDQTISSFENSADETFHGGTASPEYSPVNLLHSPDASTSDISDGGYVSNNGTTHQANNTPSASSIKHGPRESELVKLLQAKPSTYHPPAIQPLLPQQTQAVVSPPTTQTFQIQPVLPVQTQKLVISPPQPSTVQICSIYPRPIEEHRYPQTLLTLPG
jgi:hypothetical protein